MNESRLLQYFDQISEASDAILQLRRFVLDLAVRGALTAQNAADEPASELLERIQAEKARLVKAGLMRVLKPLAPIKPAEAPFAVPRGWLWIRVGDGFIYDAGTKREPRELASDRWLVELEDIEKDTSRVLTRMTVSDRASLSTKSEFRAGDILYGKLRPYLNKVVVAEEPGYSTTEIVAIRPLVPLCPDYLCVAFRRSDFVEYVSRLGRGTKMPRLRTPDALMALFPLPPVAEQHRIVSNVNELMALCDRLEAAQAERESRRDRLVAASLDRLNRVEDDESLRRGARFHLENLPRLTTRSERIPALHRAILNLAVRGRLVCQDANEEPASILLGRLTAATEAACRDYGISPPKPEPIGDEALPFAAPAGWSWSRLCSLFNVVTDGDHLPPPKSESGVAFLTIGNVTTGRLEFNSCRFVSAEYFASIATHRRPLRGDILYTVVGATYGRPVFVDADRAFCVQRHIAILKPALGMDVRFLCYVLASPLVYGQASKSTTGTAQPTIPLRSLRQFLIPVPPLDEQRRIVTVVDELTSLCGQLETQQEAAQDARRRFLYAALRESLASAL